jgi:hypothetical protein
VRDPDHDAHAWCGRICVPKFLHKQFKKALGGPVKYRPKRMRAFYFETLTAIPSAKPIGEEPVKFWRGAFAMRFSGVTPKKGPTAGISGSVCPHVPMCSRTSDCIARILAEGRARKEA